MNGTGQAQPNEGSAIQHEPAKNRFTTAVEGQTGYVEYQARDGVMTITHTVVPPPIGGRGIAGRLVAAALNHARAEGLKVVPQCSYAAAYIDKNPQYADLVA